MLFADSQETREGYAKKEADKIEHFTVRNKSFRVLTAGAGSGHHVDALACEIRAAVSKIPDYDFDKIVTSIRTVVLEFFQKHAWGRVDKPDLEMLIAIHPTNGRAEAFHMADGLVNHIPGGSKSIGVGSYLADF